MTLTKAERWLKRYCPLNPYVELYSLVGPSEKMLHIFVRQRLQATFGKEETEWWVKGVPEGIRDKCAQRREHDPIRRPLYAQTDFTDLIAILAKRWSLFEHDFKRVKGQYKSSKDFLDDMARLVEIRHVVSHPVRGVPTEEDLIFARQMRETIEKFCGYERTCDTATEDLTT